MRQRKPFDFAIAIASFSNQTNNELKGDIYVFKSCVCAGVVEYLRNSHPRRLNPHRLVRFRACTGPIIPFEALTMVGLPVTVLPDDDAVGLQPPGEPRWVG